jgi:CheY-like chemotaxis protein
MAALPRVLTVDPTGRLSRIARAAIDLGDLAAVQVDVPGGAEALEELRYTPCTLMITAYTIDGTDPDMDGLTLATVVKREHPLTAVMVVADAEEGEDAIAADAPFLYLRRPLDSAQVMRIITAALHFRDIFLAAQQPTRRIEQSEDIGGLPPLDANFAYGVFDELMGAFPAMAILLLNRTGEIVAERIAAGYIDRDALAAAITPNAKTTISMSDVVGQNPSTFNFFSGDKLDLFTLSVGFHYVLCIVFDRQSGQRQFGAVNRFGRRAVEDLRVMLGTSAFSLNLPSAQAEEAPRRRRTTKAITQELTLPDTLLERTSLSGSEDAAPAPAEAAPPPAPEPVRMTPIADFDVSLIEGGLNNLDALMAQAEDLFDMDKLAEIADEGRSERGPISYDQARQLGIIS